MSPAERRAMEDRWLAEVRRQVLDRIRLLVAMSALDRRYAELWLRALRADLRAGDVWVTW